MFLSVAYRQLESHRLTFHHICPGNTSITGLHSRWSRSAEIFHRKDRQDH